MHDVLFLLPVLALSGFACVLLAIDAVGQQTSPNVRRLSVWIALTATIVAAVLIAPANGSSTIFGRQMLVWDGLAYFVSWITVLTIFFVILLSEQTLALRDYGLSAYFALLLLAGAGLILLAGANDFLMILVGVELVGIPSFILTGYLWHKDRSNRAAITYFLVGAFSTGMLAYGISILYGMTGSTSLSALHQQLPTLVGLPAMTVMAFFFILVSFGFEMALVPFHMWLPDVFEGAPAPIAAFLSVAPKITGAIITLRVFGLALIHPAFGQMQVLAVLAAVTMTVANIMGLMQTNVIRLLAYSSIAHMGYLLLGLVAGTAAGVQGMFLYGVVYLFMNLGIFALVIPVGDASGSQELESYRGLSKRQPMLSALFVLFVFSLAGLPPMAGFFAKFNIFAAAWNAGWHWLVLVATANTVLSAAYYLKILKAIYFEPRGAESPVEIRPSTRVALGLTAFFTLLLSFAPQVYLWKARELAPEAAVVLPEAAPVAGTVNGSTTPDVSTTTYQTTTDTTTPTLETNP